MFFLQAQGHFSFTLKRAYSSSNSSIVKEVSVTIVRTFWNITLTDRDLKPMYHEKLISFQKLTDLNLCQECYFCTYHIALCSIFKGLNNFQSLFESHLFNQICSDTSKFLKTKRKRKGGQNSLGISTRLYFDVFNILI